MQLSANTQVKTIEGHCASRPARTPQPRGVRSPLTCRARCRRHRALQGRRNEPKKRPGDARHRVRAVRGRGQLQVLCDRPGLGRRRQHRHLQEQHDEAPGLCRRRRRAVRLHARLPGARRPVHQRRARHGHVRSGDREAAPRCCSLTRASPRSTGRLRRDCSPGKFSRPRGPTRTTPSRAASRSTRRTRRRCSCTPSTLART